MNPNIPGLQIVEQLIQAASVALTGGVAETVLATLPLPAGLIGPNGEIEIEYDMTETNNANNKTVTVRLGGLTGTALLTHTANTLAGRAGRMCMRQRNANNSQQWNGTTFTAAAIALSRGTGAVNLSADSSIVITGTLANAGDTLTLESCKIRAYKQ